MANPNRFWIVHRSSDGSEIIYRHRTGWTKHRSEALQYLRQEADQEAARFGYAPSNSHTIEPVIREASDD